MGDWFTAYFDQLETGPGMHKWRHYFPVYQRHFAKFRGRKVNLLEVGVYSGGSLLMWRSYFGLSAHIYGVDIQPACRQYHASVLGINILIGDQGDKEFWHKAIEQIPKLDIVIDDGSHHFEHQITTFEALLPHLAPGGVYLCEDLYGSGSSCMVPGEPRHRFRDYINEIVCKMDDFTPTEDIIPTADYQQILEHGGQQIPHDHVLATNQEQSSIDSIHIYPFVCVVEMRDKPMDYLVAPMHGTEWEWFE